MHKTVPSFMAALLAIPLAGCFACDNEISQTVVSPSGELKAVVFNRGCGATTGFNTQISVIAANDSLPDDGGNTFIADDSFPVALHWASNNVLEILSKPPGRIFKEQSVVNGVSVRYSRHDAR